MSMSLEEYMKKHLAMPDVTERNADALCPACLMSAMLNPVAGDSGETWLTWRDSPAGGAWRCSRCDMDITDVDLISSYALCVNALLDRRDETLSENDRLRTELALVRKSLDDVKRICLGGLYDMTDKLTDKIGDEFSFSEA